MMIVCTRLLANGEWCDTLHLFSTSQQLQLHPGGGMLVVSYISYTFDNG
jgi:hypothetical protein